MAFLCRFSALLFILLTGFSASSEAIFDAEIKTMGCSESLFIDDLLEGYLKSAIPGEGVKSECGTLYALRLNSIVRRALEEQDAENYIYVMARLDQKIQEARAFDQKTNACPKKSDQFCGREKIYVDMVLSLQQLWSIHYVDQLSAQEWGDRLKNAGIFTGLTGGAVAAYILRFPRHAKLVSKGFTTVAKRVMQNLGILGRPTFASRLIVAGGTGAAVGGVKKKKPKSEATILNPVFPAPITFMDLGEAGNIATGADPMMELVLDVTMNSGGLIIGTIVPSAIMDAVMLRLIANAGNAKWVTMGMSLGRKPTVFALGFLLSAWIVQLQADYSRTEHLKEIDSNLAKIKARIVANKDARASFSMYLLASEYAKLASEKAMIYGLPFFVSIQDEQNDIIKQAHCLPYEPSLSPLNALARNQELDRMVSVAPLAVQKIRQTNSKEVSQSKQIFHEAIEFLSAQNRYEWTELIGSLKQSESLLWMYAGSKDLVQQWRDQASAQANETAAIRAQLDEVWAEYDGNKKLSPTGQEKYQNAIAYVGEYSMFENADGLPGFNCPNVGDHPAILWRQFLQTY